MPRSRVTTPGEVGRWRQQVAELMDRAQGQMASRVEAALRANGLSWDSPRNRAPALWSQADWRRVVDATVRPGAEQLAADIFATLHARVSLRGPWGGKADQQKLARMLVDAVLDGGHRVSAAISAGGLTAASNPPVVHPDAQPTVAAAYQSAQKELNRLASNVASHMSNAAVRVLTDTAAQREPLIANVWNCSFVPASREDHMAADGDRAKAGEAFDVGGEQLYFPGDPDGSDEQTANCLCWLEVEDLDIADLPADEPQADEEGVTAATMPPFGFNEDQPRDDHGRFGETDHVDESHDKAVGSQTPRGAHTHCQKCGYKFNSPRSTGVCNSPGSCQKRQAENDRKGITPEQRAGQDKPGSTPPPGSQVSPHVGDAGGHSIDRGPGEQLRELVPPDSSKGFGQYAVNTSDGKQVQAWVQPGLSPRETPSRESIQTMLSTAADLHEREPIGAQPPYLRIVSMDSARSAGASMGVLAYCNSGDGRAINVVGTNVERYASNSQREMNHMMPACKPGPTSTRYIVTHEYGHLHDYSRGASQTAPARLSLAAYRTAKTGAGMSRYGTTNEKEAYAETFAEWHMTGGTTTNVAAAFYADTFHWSR